MVDFSKFPVKLAPAKHDPRTLKLGKYKTGSLPPTPTEKDWTQGINNWPMLLNDKLGDCAIAGPAHQVQGWTFNNDVPDFVPTDAQVQAEYTAVAGYDPSTGANDNGCVLLDVMNRWRQVGLFGRPPIAGYVAVNPLDHASVCAAINIFGSLTIGLRLPAAAQNMSVWDAPSRHHRRFGQWAPGSWGGHCVPVLGYTPSQTKIVTWGQVMPMTFAFVDMYCDEMYAPLSQDWLNIATRVAPNGFDWASLQADLSLFSH